MPAVLLFLLFQAPQQEPARKDLHGDPLPPGALVQMGTSQRRHNRRVWRLAFTSDGKTLVSGGHDGRIRVWDASTGKALRDWDGQTQAVTSLRLSHDDRFVASGGHADKAFLWELSTGKLVRSFEGHGEGAVILGFSKDNARLYTLTGNAGNKVLTWEVSTGVRTSEVEIEGRITHSALRAGENRLYTGSLDNSVRVVDLSTGKTLSTLEGHKAFVFGLDVSPDGSRLASTSWNEERPIRIWNLKEGKLERDLGTRAFTVVVRFSPDGKILAGGLGVKGISFWNAETGDPLGQIEDFEESVSDIVFSPDGKTIASGGGSTRVRLWNVETGKEILPVPGHKQAVRGVRFSPDGRTIATMSQDRTARLWEARTGKELSVLPHPSGILDLQFSPDGKTLVTAEANQSTRLWDAKTGAAGAEWILSMHQVQSMAWFPDGKRLLVARSDQQVTTHDLVTGELEALVRVRRAPKFMIRTIALSHDGLLIAAGDHGGGVNLWNAVTKELVLDEKCHEGSTVVKIATDGRLFASAGWDNDIVLRETLKGTIVRKLPANERTYALAFSPDGRFLASGGWSGGIRLWDLATGAPAHWILPDAGDILGLEFAPDGRSLASAQEAAVALVWSLAPADAPRSKKSDDELISDLDSSDSKAAYIAAYALASRRGATARLVELIRKRSVDTARVGSLIQALGNEEIEPREKALADLTAMGPDIEPELNEALKKSGAETARLLQSVLKQFDLAFGSLPLARAKWRALHALDVMQSSESQAALQSLEKDAPHARIRREAAAALKRPHSK